MHQESKRLQDLAERVSSGDTVAAAELRHTLEPQLTLMARQVMRTGVGTSVLARRILAEARKLSPDWRGSGAEDRDGMVCRIVRSVTDSVIERLRGVPAGYPARETVCM